MICPCGTVFCDDVDHPPDVEFIPRRYCSQACARTAGQARRHRKAALRRDAKLRCCTTPAKVRYPGLAAAMDGVRRVLALHGKVQVPYQCPCGDWHLTSKHQSRHFARLAATDEGTAALLELCRLAALAETGPRHVASAVSQAV